MVAVLQSDRPPKTNWEVYHLSGADPQNMDAPQGLIWVGAQRPEVGVLAVGGHQNGVGKGRLPDLHHDRIMGWIKSPGSSLPSPASVPKGPGLLSFRVKKL